MCNSSAQKPELNW